MTTLPYSSLRSLPLLAFLAVSTAAQAQTWPSKPIRIIVPVVAGSTADILARLMSDKLAQRSGQPVVVDNRAGGSSLIGAEATAKSPPDGHTFLITGNDLTWINLVIKTNFDLRRDLAPITMLRRAYYNVWISSSVPAQTLGEFIAYAKANPGKLNFGTGGPGSATHLSAELLKLAVPALASATHVPFKGEGPAVVAMAAGDIQFAVGTYLGYAAQLAAGKVRVIGVAAPQRLAALPQTPTFVESGIPFTANYWTGFFAPGGTPREITARIAAELKTIYEMPDIKPTIVRNGEEFGGQTPEEFAKIVAEDIEFRARAVKAAGLRPE